MSHKSEEISNFEMLDVLFCRAKGFSCGLHGLYGGKGEAIFHQKINKNFIKICQL
jgi:hypothetical protein